MVSLSLCGRGGNGARRAGVGGVVGARRIERASRKLERVNRETEWDVLGGREFSDVMIGMEDATAAFYEEGGGYSGDYGREEDAAIREFWEREWGCSYDWRKREWRHTSNGKRFESEGEKRAKQLWIERKEEEEREAAAQAQAEAAAAAAAAAEEAAKSGFGMDWVNEYDDDAACGNTYECDWTDKGWTWNDGAGSGNWDEEYDVEAYERDVAYDDAAKAVALTALNVEGRGQREYCNSNNNNNNNNNNNSVDNNSNEEYGYVPRDIFPFPAPSSSAQAQARTHSAPAQVDVKVEVDADVKVEPSAPLPTMCCQGVLYLEEHTSEAGNPDWRMFIYYDECTRRYVVKGSRRSVTQLKKKGSNNASKSIYPDVRLSFRRSRDVLDYLSWCMNARPTCDLVMYAMGCDILRELGVDDLCRAKHYGQKTELYGYDAVSVRSRDLADQLHILRNIDWKYSSFDDVRTYV